MRPFRPWTWLLAVAALLAADAAFAIPALKDYWHMTCAPRGYSLKAYNKAKAKASSAGSDLKGAVAPFEYACWQSVMEKKRFEVGMTKWQEGGGKGKQPVIDNRSSMGLVKAAAAKLEAAVKAKLDYEGVYQHGLALALLANEWSINRFDEVSRTVAGTELAARADLAMAEFLFETKGAAAAMPSYKKVIKADRGFTAAWARYKLAWVDYVAGAQTKNRAKQKSAITQFAKLSQTLANKKGNEGGLGALIKDELLAIVVDYGDTAEAQKILKSVGANKVYGAFLEQSAYARMQANQAGEAYKLFGMAVKEDPKGPNVLQMRINMAGLAAQLKNIPLIVSNLKAIVANHVDEKAPARTKMKPAERKKVDQQVEQVLFDYVVGLDQQARSDNQPKSFQAADETYQLFFKAYPKSAKTYELKFFHGQLQFAMKKNKESAQTMLALINGNPKGKHTKDALAVLVTAAQTIVDADKKTYDFGKPGSIKKKVKIPEHKKLFAEALDLYAKFLPSDPNSVPMRFVSGTVYYDFGHYPDGIKRYFQFVSKHPTHEFAKPAVARIFEYYKQQGGDEGFENAKARIKAIPQLGSAPDLQPYFAMKADKKPKGDGGDDEAASEDGDDADDSKKKKRKKKKKKKKKKADDENADEDDAPAVAEDSENAEASEASSKDEDE